MNNLQIYIDSEINELKSVIVHEPGFEFELVGPENKDHLLFDDIIYPETARTEHQQLCKVINKISNYDTPCIAYSDLLSDIISNLSVRESILNEINEYEKINKRSHDILNNLDEKDFINSIIRGRDTNGNIFFKNLLYSLFNIWWEKFICPISL